MKFTTGEALMRRCVHACSQRIQQAIHRARDYLIVNSVRSAVIQPTICLQKLSLLEVACEGAHSFHLY